jgi:hypothetical protein
MTKHPNYLIFVFFRYFKIYELEAEADFPEELSKFEEVSICCEDYYDS